MSTRNWLEWTRTCCLRVVHPRDPLEEGGPFSTFPLEKFPDELKLASWNSQYLQPFEVKATDDPLSTHWCRLHQSGGPGQVLDDPPHPSPSGLLSAVIRPGSLR